ncbi:MAG: hypothetical protein WD844_15320 [Thermoleophilaceae bacterium]
MPLAPAELRRGRICWALYPFAGQFPAALADGPRVDTVEDLAGHHGGRPVRLVTEARLRPVLLLHDGTRGEQEDLVCLRVNTVKARHRSDSDTWDRIERAEHPFFLLLPATERRYGLPEDSVVAIASVGTVHKSALLGPRHVGELSRAEMETVSDRMSVALGLDLAPKVAALAKELLRRAGLVEAGGEEEGQSRGPA